MILPDDISVPVNFFRFFRIGYASRHVIATKTTKTTTTTMAVNGKKTCSRLAAATVLWLLVAIFANQNYVHCQGIGEEQQRQQQQQQQQQQQEQQILPSLQLLSPPQQPLSPPQQPLSPPQKPLSLPQKPLSPSEQPPPNQPQSYGVMSSLNILENSIKPSIREITEEAINPDLGLNTVTQQLSNDAGSLNIPIGNQVPMFSDNLPMVTGSQQSQLPMVTDSQQSQLPMLPVSQQSQLPMVTGSQQSQLPMQTGSLSKVPSFVETNPSQGMIPNSPSMQTNMPPPQNTWSLPPSVNEPMNNTQNNLNKPQNHLNNLKNPMFNHPHQHPHLQRLPSNHHFPARLSTDQLGQRLNQMPYYYINGNKGNGYEVPIQLSSNVPSYPNQLNSFMNPGELMQPMHMINNMIPTNPMQFVQKPVEMIFNTVDKFGRYGEGVKEGLTTAFRGVVGKILDQTQSGAQTVFDMGSNGTNAILNFGRRLLVPETLRKQQNPTEYGGQYYSPQQGMQPLNYAFNSQMPYPNYNGMGYNNMQPQAGTGLVTDGKNNGQMSTQHTAPQYNTEYMSQNQNMPNSDMSNPISGSQPIVRYGQP